MWKVTYDTMSDTYTKSFKNIYDAWIFCGMIHKLYPKQDPVPYRGTLKVADDYRTSHDSKLLSNWVSKDTRR